MARVPWIEWLAKWATTMASEPGKKRGHSSVGRRMDKKELQAVFTREQKGLRGSALKGSLYKFLVPLLDCKILEPSHWFSKIKTSQGVMAHACNSSTREAEGRGS